MKAPPELHLERTQRTDQIKSEYLIRGRIRNRKYLFFTGIIRTNFENWYFGDFFEIIRGQKHNSFILFHFAKDQTQFEMYFFNHFKLYPDRRGYFISEFIERIKR